MQLATDQEDLSRKIETLYRRGQLPPTLKEVEAALSLPLHQIQPLFRVLVNQGSLIKVKEDLYFPAEAIARLKAQLGDFLKKYQEITVLQFKDLTQTSRTFTIPLLEFFDTNRVTVRVAGRVKTSKKPDFLIQNGPVFREQTTTTGRSESNSLTFFT